jgi:hypothetical protein
MLIYNINKVLIVTNTLAYESISDGRNIVRNYPGTRLFDISQRIMNIIFLSNLQPISYSMKILFKKIIL